MASFVGRLADGISRFPARLRELQQFLEEDRLLASRESPEYAQARSLIQNAMDATRFLSQITQYFSQLIVPLGEVPPRNLNIINSPPGYRISNMLPNMLNMPLCKLTIKTNYSHGVKFHDFSRSVKFNHFSQGVKFHHFSQGVKFHHFTNGVKFHCFLMVSNLTIFSHDVKFDHFSQGVKFHDFLPRVSNFTTLPTVSNFIYSHGVKFYNFSHGL